MDLATGLGLIGGIAVVVVLIMIDGGNFAAYFDKHAVIVIFGGATAATMTRYPFAVLAHGLPMGMKFAFGGRAMQPRDLGLMVVPLLRDLVAELPLTERVPCPHPTTDHQDHHGERLEQMPEPHQQRPVARQQIT